MKAALWVKAPVLLPTRFMSLFFGVVFGAAILAAAATSGPAFIASSERAALTRELQSASRWTTGLHVSTPITTFSEEVFAPGRLKLMGESGSAFLSELTDGVEGLAGVHTTYIGGGSTLVSSTDNVPVRLVDRTDALDHIRFVERSDADGLYIADETARQLAVDVGDVVELDGERGSKQVEVAGLYRFIPFDRDREFWAPYAINIYRATDADTYPPAFIFASPGTYFSLAEAIGDYNDLHWEVPLEDVDLSLHEAEQLDRDIQRVISDVYAGFTRFRGMRDRFLLDADTAMPGQVSAAQDRIGTVIPAVQLLSLAARAVAAAILAALGYYLVKRRRTEVLTLVARGSSPASIGARAVLEALPAVVVGGAVGALGGTLAVAQLGPAPGWELVALLDSVPSVGWTLLAGLVILGIVVGATSAREERGIAGNEPHRLPRTLAAGVAALAAAGGATAYIAYLEPVASTRDPAGLVPTLMPVVLIFAAAVAGAAVVKMLFGLIAARARGRRVAGYLAARRLAGAPGMVQVLVAATACAAGVMFYGTTVSRSVEETAEAKARVFIGSDVGVQLSANADLPDLPLKATVVARVQRATLAPNLDVAMIGIEPDTFADAVYWEEGFSDTALSALIERISQRGSLPPAVAIGPISSEPVIAAAGGDVPLEVVGRATSFPGQNSSDPMLVVSRETFDELLGSVGASMSSRQSELWSKGTDRRVVGVLQRTDVSYFTVTTAEAVLQAPALQSTLWTLGLLGALGAASGVAAVAGLVLYMQARHRSALVSSAMTRRMRLTRSAELRAWVFEVGASMGSSYVLAVIVGVGVARLMHERLDLRPTLPPEPVLVVPMLVLAGTAVAAAVLAVLTAVRLQRQVDRANVAEVLRI